MSTKSHAVKPESSSGFFLINCDSGTAMQCASFDELCQIGASLQPGSGDWEWDLDSEESLSDEGSLPSESDDDDSDVIVTGRDGCGPDVEATVTRRTQTATVKAGAKGTEMIPASAKKNQPKMPKPNTLPKGLPNFDFKKALGGISQAGKSSASSSRPVVAAAEVPSQASASAAFLPPADPCEVDWDVNRDVVRVNFW